jgi:hypothetical protein
MDILNIYNLSVIRGLAGFNTVFFYMKWCTIIFQKQMGFFRYEGRTMIGMIRYN